MDENDFARIYAGMLLQRHEGEKCFETDLTLVEHPELIIHSLIVDFDCEIEEQGNLAVVYLPAEK